MQSLPFQVMAKPCGPVCNLDCRCCYYLVKQRMYPGAAFRMSDALLKEYTRQYLEAHPAGDVTFTWQGGEPTLMGLGFFRRAVELQQQLGRPGQHVKNAIQTNALGLDSEWCEFFRTSEFLVGVSVDGPGECHDAIRVTPGGKPSLQRVLRGVRELRQHEVSYNILACVHQANQSRPLDVYRFFRDELGAEFIQFIPVVTRDNELRGTQGGQLIPESVGSREYGEFLIGVFDEWSRRDIGRVYVQMFDAVLAGWVGENPGLCVHQETCGRALVLEHNGDVFSCDHFVEPAYRLGNIQEMPLDQMLRSAAQRRFGRDKRDRLPTRCRECRYLAACRGGCPKDRLVELAAGEPPLSYLCEGYLLFYAHVEQSMEFMAAELRAGRPPANLMSRLRGKQPQTLTNANVERNDPCPCGSGKKFKHCHGRA